MATNTHNHFVAIQVGDSWDALHVAVRHGAPRPPLRSDLWPSSGKASDHIIRHGVGHPVSPGLQLPSQALEMSCTHAVVDMAGAGSLESEKGNQAEMPQEKSNLISFHSDFILFYFSVPNFRKLDVNIWCHCGRGIQKSSVPQVQSSIYLSQVSCNTFILLCSCTTERFNWTGDMRFPA